MSYHTDEPWFRVEYELDGKVILIPVVWQDAVEEEKR
jgi:hypothetical protein